MTLGLAPKQGDLLRTTVGYCESRIGADSICAVLNRECFTLFPDEIFADLFTDVGRRSVPPMIVAVVMVLRRIEGCSDREAVDRFAFDARWKYAAGGLAFDYPGFVHTVLVDMRARLAASGRPDRIFEVTLAAAKAAGLVGRRRVLDSTPLYDAVATMDTVTLIRSGIRGVFKAAGADLEAQLRAVIRRDDDYATAGKPVCDYDDRAARKQLVDALAKDGTAVLVVLEGRELDPAATQASWNDAFGQSTAVRSTAPSAGGVQRAARQPDPGLFVAAAVGRNEDDRFDAHVPADVVRSYSAGRIRAGQPPGRAVPRVPGRPRPAHPPGRARRPAACAYRSVVGLPVPSGLVARTDEPVGASVRAKLRATSVTQLRHYWALSAAKPGRRLLIRVGE